MNTLGKSLLFAGAAALAAGLAGCQTPKVTQEEMESVNYGPAPVHWKDEINGYLSLRLRNPKEAVVDFRTEPKKFFQKQVALDPQVHGWAVCVWVRDKNRQGEFEKMYPMVVFIRNEKIVAVNNGPENFGPSGPIYAKQQCKELGAPFPDN
jgi:hypothetical protein